MNILLIDKKGQSLNDWLMSWLKIQFTPRVKKNGSVFNIMKCKQEKSSFIIICSYNQTALKILINLSCCLRENKYYLKYFTASFFFKEFELIKKVTK